jgi:hypothetical protein
VRGGAWGLFNGTGLLGTFPQAASQAGHVLLYPERRCAVKTWRGWTSVALLGAATVAAAYVIGSGSVSAVPLPLCRGCDCKNIYLWKVQQDNFGQGLVDNTGAPVLYGFTGICVDQCPNTPNVKYFTQLDRRRYDEPNVTCDNGAFSMCRGVTQEAVNGTLSPVVLGQTTRAECRP